MMAEPYYCLSHPIAIGGLALARVSFTFLPKGGGGGGGMLFWTFY